MTYEQIVFIIRLLSLPRKKIGTRCIQWIMAYIIDCDDDMSTADVSRYLGFNRLYYPQSVKKMILRIGGELNE